MTPLTVLVTGSRTWRDEGTVQAALVAVHVAAGGRPVRLVHGAAAGADLIAARLAARLAWSLVACPVTGADWRLHGKAAGPIRNRAMLAEKPDLVLAFWNGRSTGTQGMLRMAAAAGVPVAVFKGGA